MPRIEEWREEVAAARTWEGICAVNHATAEEAATMWHRKHEIAANRLRLFEAQLPQRVESTEER